MASDQATAAGRGKDAETVARNYLEAHGLRFQSANYRCRQGEIDLIMHDGDTVVFVEVRYRTNPRFGSGAESVNRTKQHRLIAAAQHYLARHPAAARRPCRFDVLGLGPANQRGSVDWIRNAIELS